MKIRRKLNPKPILNLILKQLAEQQLTWIVNDFGADYSVEIRKGISLGIQYRILVRLFKIENVYIKDAVGIPHVLKLSPEGEGAFPSQW